MALSRITYPERLKLAAAAAVTLFFLIFCLTFLPSPPPKSAEGLVFSSKNYNENLQKKKMILGSKPPGCVNKCFSCRPCMATLVVPSHQKKGFTIFKAPLSHRGDDDDDNNGYYLLSWKCRCGDKLFQP